MTRRAVAHGSEPCVRRHADTVETRAQERDRMGLERKAKRTVVVDDMLAARHDRQAGFRLVIKQADPARSNRGRCSAAVRHRGPHLPRARRVGRSRWSGKHQRGSVSRFPGHRGPSAATGRARISSRRHAARRKLIRFSARPFIRRKPSRTACALRMTPRISACLARMRPGSNPDFSSVQSHWERLMSTSRMATPWSRASRTSCAGA